MSLNQQDFRKILATPRTTSGAAAPPLLTPRHRPAGSSSNPFKKPVARIRREGRSDALDKSHVDLGTGFTDRAKERRLAELRGESETTGEVKGLDFELLKKVKAGEFVMPQMQVPESRRGEGDSDESDGEGDGGDEEALLDELLAMEMEIKKELEEEEERKKEKARRRVEEVTKSRSPQEDDALDSKAETTRSRFKPVIDARQLKQMKKEQKRRKLAMQAMDRVATPTASTVSMAPRAEPTTTTTAKKKSRAELLEQLRRIQAAKKETSEAIEARDVSTSVPTETSTTISMPPPPVASPKSEEVNGAVELFTEKVEAQPTPSIRSPSPPRPAKVQVGENMFSDESDLSDYNPYGDDSDEDTPAPTKQALKEPSEPVQSTGSKRNYFGDKDPEPEVKASHLITMDPVVAAALRKATAMAEKSKLPEIVVKEKRSNQMSLGGVDGVYEFDEGVDTWDGELDEEEDVGLSRKRKRKDK